MLIKNSSVLTRIFKGGKEVTSVYKGGKLLYSAFVLMGTTYNATSWSQTATTSDASVWQFEVLGVAGTDDGGTYYNFGVRDCFRITRSTGTLWDSLVSAISPAYVRSVWRICSDSRDYRTTYAGINALGLKEVDMKEWNEVTGLSNFMNGNSVLTTLQNMFKTITNLRNGFRGCTALTGTDMSNTKISADCNLDYLFYNCAMWATNPRLETWTAEDGVSKPTVGLMSGAFYNFGASLTDSSLLFDIDLSGWTIKTYSNNAVGGITFGNCKHRIVNIDKLRFLPVSVNGSVIGLDMRGMFNDANIETVDTSSWNASDQYDLILTGNYLAFGNNPTLTSVNVTGFKATTDSAPLFNMNVFQGTNNITSLIIDYNFCDGYRNDGKLLNTFNLQPLTQWTNQTQIHDFLVSLSQHDSQMYSRNNMSTSIAFSTQTYAVIQGMSDWSTLSAAIAAHGWNLILPVSVNNVLQNINMSELE